MRITQAETSTNRKRVRLRVNLIQEIQDNLKLANVDLVQAKKKLEAALSQHHFWCSQRARRRRAYFFKHCTYVPTVL